MQRKIKEKAMEIKMEGEKKRRAMEATEKAKARDLGLKALKSLDLRVWFYFMWLTVQSSDKIL
jgi:hypothetical protein